MSKILNIIAVSMMALPCVSCSLVSFGGEEKMQASVDVDIRMDWKDDVMEIPPMYVAMNRIINTVHYVYEVAPDALSHTGESGVHAGEDGSAGKTVMNGEYYMMAFSRDEGCYEIDGIEEFSRNAGFSMRDIHARLSRLPEEDINGVLGDNYADFNPSIDYLKNAFPLYVDVRKQFLSPEHPSEIVFKPANRTLELEFRFTVELDEGVSLSSIVADVSGVPGAVCLMTGVVDKDELYRVFIPMVPVGTETTVRTYEGAVNVLGLFPSEDADFISGPGIMHISITARSGDSERILYAGINLRKTILELGLMTPLEDGSGYVLAKDKAVIEIQNTLKIKNGQVVPGIGGPGIDVWFPSEKIDVEV